MNVAVLPKLYTDMEVSISLRVCKETVARLRRRKLLGSVKVAGNVYITGAHIAAYLERNEITVCTTTSKPAARTASTKSGGMTQELSDQGTLARVHEITRSRKRS